VHPREDGGANDRKKSHRFRSAVNRGPPPLASEKKNRGNQRSGVTNTDPEDEIGNIPCPTDGDVVPPNPDSGKQQIK
jgi:hypothetical protein